MLNTFIERRRPVWRFITHRSGPGLHLVQRNIVFWLEPGDSAELQELSSMMTGLFTFPSRLCRFRVT